MNPVGFLLGVLIIVGLYFLPTWIALFRSRPNTGAIFALNFFLGFTFIGWVVALVWSLSRSNIEIEAKVDIKK